MARAYKSYFCFVPASLCLARGQWDSQNKESSCCDFILHHTYSRDYSIRIGHVNATQCKRNENHVFTSLSERVTECSTERHLVVASHVFASLKLLAPRTLFGEIMEKTKWYRLHKWSHI